MKKKNGFTLLELMISLSIFSIFSLFVYKTYFDQIKSYNNLKYKIEASKNAELILSKLTLLIRNSIIVDSSNLNNLYFLKDSNNNINKLIAQNVTLSENGESVTKDLNILSISANSNDAYLNLDTISNTLKYKNGLILCENVKSIVIEHSENLLTISIVLFYGKDLKYEYCLKTALNIRG